MAESVPSDALKHGVLDDLHIEASTRAWNWSEALGPADVQGLRSLLGGGSVVDWRRLLFTHRAEVIRFLAVNGYDIDNPAEMARLRTLHAKAVAYLEGTFDVRLTPSLLAPHEIADLFLIASKRLGNRDEQRAACALLKVMHVFNHLEARRLVHHISVSERSLFLAAASKVDEVVQDMISEGLPIVTYEPSTKTEHSLVTKLISKPRVTAAQIFDKLRFRLVVEDKSGLVDVVLWLLRHLFPFNHVIAGESHNTILDEEELAATLQRRLSSVGPWWAQTEPNHHPFNPATSPSFRMVNFVVDLPVRISRVSPELESPRRPELGHLVHVALEFQLFDTETERVNSAGDGNHANYKRRQLQMVSRRLWGPDHPTLLDT